jgi:hypothetical protein
MGANWFTTYSRGKDVKDAYSKAVEHADDVHGHQEGYSGEINSSAGFRDVTREFKASGKSMPQFMSEQMDKLSKHQGAQAICIEEPRANTNKTKSQVENIVTPGTKRWILTYVVYCGGDRIGNGFTKAEAVRIGREYSEKHQCTTMVRMEKVLEKKDTALVAKITYKKSSNEKDGKWIFFGWASY